MIVIFDADTHAYRDDAGVQLSGVTSVLKSAGLVDTRFFDDYARDRGTLVHQACAMYDLGTLDDDSLDPVLQPYMEAWERFKGETGFLSVDIERVVVNEKLRYAGTLDRTGVIGKDRWLWDLKSGVPQPSTAIQTAAYAGCLDGRYRRGAVELTAEGKYKITEYKDKTDWQIWLKCLDIANWKRKNGGQNE